MITIKRKEEILLQEEVDFNKPSDSLMDFLRSIGNEKMKSISYELNEGAMTVDEAVDSFVDLDAEKVKSVTVEIF